MSPQFDDLPPPPPGKVGWPWTLEGPVPHRGGEWPKISITTPSFNQGPYIEETIRSILLQGYPNLEYFINDGGSQDETVSILKKYEPWLSGWVSAKDGGQTDAINKGIARSAGEIIAYLNSDDWYYPGALFDAARIFSDDPKAMWVCGQVNNCWTPEKISKRHEPRATKLVELLGRKNYGFHQPGMFWRRELIEKVGPFDLELQYSFCPDFWARCIINQFEPINVQKPFAGFRLHSASKSCSAVQRFLAQDWIVLDRYAAHLSPAELKIARQWLREYEAAALHDSVYNLLAEGRPDLARRFIWEHLSLLPKVKPLKIVPGILYRTFITGKPPRWFRP